MKAEKNDKLPLGDLQITPVRSPARPIKLRTLRWHHLFCWNVMVVQGENKQEKGLHWGDSRPQRFSKDTASKCEWLHVVIMWWIHELARAMCLPSAPHSRARPLAPISITTPLFNPHHMLITPNMPAPFIFPNFAPTHNTIYFSIWLYSFFFAFISSLFSAQYFCHASLTLSGFLSPHLFRWARHTSQVAFSPVNPSKTLKHPHFRHCFFSICNVPSKCFFVLTCFAQPLFLILHSHISQ